MPVGVPGSNRDDSRLRLRSGDPASAGAVLAPVMRDLEHVDARDRGRGEPVAQLFLDRKSTRLNSSHVRISYAVFCLKKKKSEPKAAPAIHKNNQPHQLL